MVTEGDKIIDIERKWFGGELECNSQANAIESASVVSWTNGYEEHTS